MTQEVIVYDPAMVDQVIAEYRTKHSHAVAKAGNRLEDARTLAIRGAIEPLSGEWSNDDRFWVRSQYSEHRYLVTTGSHPMCDCPDFARTNTPCKHIWAVSIVCQVRFQHGYAPSLEQEMQEYAEEVDTIEDDAEDGDVVSRAIQEMKSYE
jgi:hypothetical protein